MGEEAVPQGGVTRRACNVCFECNGVYVFFIIRNHTETACCQVIWDEAMPVLLSRGTRFGDEAAPMTKSDTALVGGVAARELTRAIMPWG